MANQSIDVRLLQARYEAMIGELDRERKRNGGPSEPPGGGEMEARVAKLEAHVEYIRRDLDSLKSDLGEFRAETKSSLGKVRDTQERDFRLIFGCLIAVALGLAGLMAKGFNWI